MNRRFNSFTRGSNKAACILACNCPAWQARLWVRFAAPAGHRPTHDRQGRDRCRRRSWAGSTAERADRCTSTSISSRISRSCLPANGEVRMPRSAMCYGGCRCRASSPTTAAVATAAAMTAALSTPPCSSCRQHLQMPAAMARSTALGMHPPGNLLHTLFSGSTPRWGVQQAIDIPWHEPSCCCCMA